MIRKLFGIAPQKTENGAYIPSPVSLRLATSSKTNYEPADFNGKYAGSKKILMVCTEDKYMTMKNGKRFSTGNHPVEMLVPMLHLQKAGFDTVIATPSGKSVKIEEWAMPEADSPAMQLLEEYRPSFENPKNLADLMDGKKINQIDPAAIFIPGGHGAMLRLPKDENLSHLLHWAFIRDLHIMVICHGPAALLAARKEDKPFLFDGYSLASFPDSADGFTPYLGYLPGKVPWKFNEELHKNGVKTVNKMADDTYHKDRKLISGASPLAANKFGKLAAEALLKEHL